MKPPDPEPAVSMVWFEVALVIFMVVFILIVAWVLLARGSHFRRASQIPLEDDQVVTPRTLESETEDADRASKQEASHEPR